MELYKWWNELERFFLRGSRGFEEFTPAMTSLRACLGLLSIGPDLYHFA
jgi:hypothetical protein